MRSYPRANSVSCGPAWKGLPTDAFRGCEPTRTRRFSDTHAHMLTHTHAHIFTHVHFLEEMQEILDDFPLQDVK